MILIQIIKIIGIVLGALLAVALLLLLLVLFVPIRYKGELDFDDKADANVLVKASASWFLRAISVRYLFDGEKSDNAVFVFGRKLKDED